MSGRPRGVNTVVSARLSSAPPPRLDPPWPTVRSEAEKAIAGIVVSHRVRKKVSGPLHKETIYGDTGDDIKTKSGVYRQFVTRKKVEALSKGEIAEIRDAKVRDVVAAWVEARGGDPKKAFPPFPPLGENGPEIRKVRLLSKQQLALMAPVSTGFADLGNNHHIAIYRSDSGKPSFEIVSLLEAVRRNSSGAPVVMRQKGGDTFAMSLSAGDAIEFPDGDRKGIRVVQSVWASGAIVTLDHRDAEGATVWRPSAGSLLGSNARKVSIDPIGRVRPARD